jgi:nitric oxide reductase subunit B
LVHTVLHEQEAEEGPLSPWWVRSVLIVLAVGFAGLIAITSLAYRNAPPIPAKIVDETGATVFTGDDIRDGQAVFLRYGLMNNGTIWGHGAYLGPDYSAEALHQVGINVVADLSQEHYGQPWSALTPMEQAAIRAQVAVTLKTNRNLSGSDHD